MSDIICFDSNGDRITKLTQWDHDLTLFVSGIETSPVPEFRYSNRNSKESIPVQAYVAEGYVYAAIPNSLLCEPLPISLQIFYVYQDDGARTKHELVIHVTPAARPASYVYTPTLARTWENIERMVSETETRINEIFGTAENLESYVNIAVDAASNAEAFANDAIIAKDQTQKAVLRAEEIAKLVNAEQIAENIAAKADGIWKDPETGLVYLLSGETILGDGVEVGTGIGGGLTFDSGYVDAENKLHLTMSGVDIEGFVPFAIPAGGGEGGVGSIMTLTTSLGNRELSILERDNECIIPFSWTSVDRNDGKPTGSGFMEWTVDGSRVALVGVKQGDASFDVRPYLSSGENTVVLKVTDIYGSFRTMVFVVTVMAYGLSWNLPESGIYSGEGLTVRLTPIGSGDKTLKLAMDGEIIHEETVTTTGRPVTVTVPEQNHGAHTLTAWVEVDLGDDTLTTEKLHHTAAWLSPTATTGVVAVLTPEITVTQYGTAAIRFFIADRDNETVTAALKAGGETVRILENVDRTVRTWNYKCETAGSFNLSIETADAVGNVRLTVEATGYDVSPVTEGLVLDLDPAGHNNAETGRETFGYSDGSGVNHPLTFSQGFDWINGGFQTDSDGVTAFVIPRGHRVTLDRGLFDNDCRTNGRSLKMIFKSENVRNYDARLMSCKAGKVGMEVTAQSASISSQLESMSVPYYEGNRIEMEVCIQGEHDGSLAWIELGGIQSCPPVKYGSTDSWGQSTPVKLVIGSDDADVWVYRLKLHDLWLSGPERRANYVADALTTNEMANRSARNDIYNEDGTMNLGKVAKANPDLRVIHIRANRMTTGKEDEVACDFEHIFQAGGEEHHLIVNGATFKAQGTSSLEYILAALNLDVDFSTASSFTNGLGTAMTAYAMTENSIPVDYFNLKANVASSESANNVCLADEYNTWNPYVCDPKKQDSRVRDTVEGHPCAVFFTSTATAPIEVGARTVQPGETILYFVGDMNNSKKNFAVFGQDNAKYPKQCCVEIMNNTELPCRFKANISDDEKWKDGNFEFRFPKNPTDEMKNAFKTVQRWVVSTDRDAATGNAIEPVGYDGTMYHTDTAEYRAAKFKAEFADYFVPEAMDFHYLFTDENCMTDNRAKNLFFCYEYVAELNDYRWSVRCDYDNDTGLGNDNSGGLTFGYGLEDTDMAGDSWVFNAHDSVLWCNIRDLRAEELTRLHMQLSGKGAWEPARRSQKFRDYQDAVCAALRSEDMNNKYFLPWINKDGAAYAKKCYGVKADQRDQFFYYQRVYKGSQHIDVSNRSDAISMRVTVDRAENGNMTVTCYSDMYIVVMYGNGGRVIVRAKRNTPTLIQCPTDSLGDTETYLFFASNLTAISSLAAMKPKFVLATTAARLQELIVGSGDVGYENNNLNQIGVGNNQMLKILDLRNCPKLETALDLSALISLEEFLANGSGITGVTFAKGAPLHTVRLPAVGSLVAMELSKLQTFAVDGSHLLTLRVEGTPAIDTLELCRTAVHLERGRLTNVNWVDNDASVLMRLSKLGGLDALGKATGSFVLTGRCHVRSITQIELNAITASFPELELTYDSVVPTFTFTFRNYDGTDLNVQHVRQGGYAMDPVASGLIATPKQPSDVEYHYDYAGWDKSLQNADGDRIITAVFTPRDRYYRVTRWSSVSEGKVLQEKSVIAHGSCPYEGDDPEGEGIWMGWDKEAVDVVSDMDIHAVFVVPSQPAVVVEQFDYLYSDDPGDDSAYTLAEFLWILENCAGKTYFQIGDRIRIVPAVNDIYKDADFILQVCDFNHYRLADGSGMAGVVFGMVGVMNAGHRMNAAVTNEGGWRDTEMRSWLNAEIFPTLPVRWKTLIREVEIRTAEGGTGGTILTTIDRLFLLGRAETGLDSESVPHCNEVDAEAEHVVLPVFTDTTSRVRKTFNGMGSAQNWWHRTPDETNMTHFYNITSSGLSGGGNKAYIAIMSNYVSWYCCMGVKSV